MAAVVVTSATLFATLLDINDSLAALSILWATNFVMFFISSVVETGNDGRMRQVFQTLGY